MPPAAAAAPPARERFFALAGLAAPAAAAGTQRRREDDLEALAADLNDDALAFAGVGRFSLGAGRRPRGDVVDERRLDPAGVDLERALGGGEVGVGDDGEVKRDDGGDSLNHHLLEGPAGALQGLRCGWRR